MINIKWSLENQAQHLDRAAQNAYEARQRTRCFAKKFFNQSQTWEVREGGDPTGEKVVATMKEIKLMTSNAETQYLKKLAKLKPGRERPKLVTYCLPDRPKPQDKKLWEP